MIRYTILILLTSFTIHANSQIPVEVLAGHEKTTLDIMFFKYFKNNQNENSKFLFFNRNRASIDYDQTETNNLPQFGFTEAISFNHSSLKGLAPVMVVQILNRGVFLKAGIQYVLIRKDITIFCWAVIEASAKPFIDLFLLIRYTPKLTDRLNLFTQLESFNSLRTSDNASNSFVQRFRLGLKLKEWQFGIGGDFSQSGIATYTFNSNLGPFIRHEF